MRHCSLHGIDGADQVGVDHIGPGLSLRLTLHAGDTGLRDDDIDLAELVDALLDRCAHLRGVADVGLDRHDATAFLLDQTSRLVEIFLAGHRVADGREVLAPIDSDDVGALGCELDCMAAALTPRRAGDECDLAFYASHCSSLRSSMWFSQAR